MPTYTCYGHYGDVAFQHTDPRFWNCMNSDYQWLSIFDDYGNLVSVSDFTNLRGY